MTMPLAPTLAFAELTPLGCCLELKQLSDWTDAGMQRCCSQSCLHVASFVGADSDSYTYWYDGVTH